MSYPPQRVVIVVLKLERKLRLYAAHRRGSPVFVHEYFVRGTSGKIGPKLREGDYQVPEGIYGISHLNPNSRFHLSLHIDYPNAFDRQMAMRDGRDMLGGNIYIHGGGESTGCVAIGDEAVEELFVLAADVGAENLKVVISPLDLRQADPETADGRLPRWAGKLYLSLRRALAELDEQRP